MTDSETVKNDPNRLTTYDYELPPDLIAAEPVERRDGARLLIVNRSTGQLTHGTIRDLPDLLAAGDHLVANNTRVVPARLRGTRDATGGKWEGLFLRSLEGGEWELLSQTRGILRAGETISVAEAATARSDLTLKLLRRGESGGWIVQPLDERPAFELLELFGEMPLPPYIRKGVARPEDRERYQTVYGDRPGSVAAPTAGLHFTPELLAACESRGVSRSHVTLHVGIGTFRPMTADRLDEHVMHREWGELDASTAAGIRRTQDRGGRIVSVGTTSVRVLESAARSGRVEAFREETDLFIRPPYQFRAVDALLTNFHLPRSTLLVLVSTFAGRDLIREAYAVAIEQRYRFFSYGDAMLIL